MLTPRFELTQDDEFIILTINAPYAKVAETEFHIEDEIVCFYSKPYYLRLHLPKRLLDDDRNEAKYNVDKGTFTARITKENKGEVFEGLDMLTKLLTPSQTGAKSTIPPDFLTEINSQDVDQDQPSVQDKCTEIENSENVAEAEEGEEFDWYIDQSYPSEAECTISEAKVKYGFAQTKFGLSQIFLSEFGDIFHVKDPDNLCDAEKRQQRLAHEYGHFSDEHYLADLHDNEEILEILNFKPWWSDSCAECQLTEEAKDLLLKLPKKKHFISAEILPSVYLGLVDIVFAYAYNCRVLYGENNVESGWTIAKLAATLSWFESFTSLQDVVLSCFRRALTFPFYRNWELCIKVLEDVQVIFAGGKKPILKCLLDVHACMIACDPHYIFNDLYITDYCVWIQSAKSKKIQSLAGALKAVVISKSDIGFELEELEHAAQLVLNEKSGQDIGEMTDKLEQMNFAISRTVLDSDDDTDGTDDSDEDDTDRTDDNDTDGTDDNDEDNTDRTGDNDEVSEEGNSKMNLQVKDSPR